MTDKPLPTVPADKRSECMNRRDFLNRMAWGMSIFAAGMIGIPVAGAFLGPLFRKPTREWRTVGKVGDFKVGTTTEVRFLDASPLPWAGPAGKTASWLRRESESEFIAFSVDCTHLGCPVRWLPDASLFMCPCHGGVYYEDGTVAGGPPPKPLPRYLVRVRDGMVEVKTSELQIRR